MWPLWKRLVLPGIVILTLRTTNLFKSLFPRMASPWIIYRVVSMPPNMGFSLLAYLQNSTSDCFPHIIL